MITIKQSELLSDIKKEKEKDEEEIKDIYFIILYPRTQQEKPDDFTFMKNDINPRNIYTDETKKENGTYFYKKVFKFIGKTDNKYIFEFEIVEDYYIITFEVKKNSFIYDVELKRENKITKNIAPENIDQKIINYKKKLDIFSEAIKESLYKDTFNSIDLFEKKKNLDFSMVISLFVQIYKNKELCPLLTILNLLVHIKLIYISSDYFN